MKLDVCPCTMVQWVVSPRCFGRCACQLVVHERQACGQDDATLCACLARARGRDCRGSGCPVWSPACCLNCLHRWAEVALRQVRFDCCKDAGVCLAKHEFGGFRAPTGHIPEHNVQLLGPTVLSACAFASAGAESTGVGWLRASSSSSSSCWVALCGCLGAGWKRWDRLQVGDVRCQGV